MSSIHSRESRWSGRGNCLPSLWSWILPVGLFSQATLLPFRCPCIDAVVLSVRLGPECHHSCPDRTYSVNDTMTCAPCEDEKCEICDHAQCYLCEDGFYILGNILTVPNFARLQLWLKNTVVWLEPQTVLKMFFKSCVDCYKCLTSYS